MRIIFGLSIAALVLAGPCFAADMPAGTTDGTAVPPPNDFVLTCRSGGNVYTKGGGYKYCEKKTPDGKCGPTYCVQCQFNGNWSVPYPC